MNCYPYCKNEISFRLFVVPNIVIYLPDYIL